jgi:hypothetical protein
MKKLETIILIEGSPAEVWSVLTDFESYPKWNPFIKAIEGAPIVGQRIQARIQPPGRKLMTFRPKVLVFSPELEFRWLGNLGIPGIFDGEHYFQLEATGDQHTKFTHGEEFSGLLSGLMLRWIGGATLAGFEAMNIALKKSAEKLATHPKL